MRGFLKLLAVLICGSLIFIWLPLEPSFADDPPTYTITAPADISFGDMLSSGNYNSENLALEYKTITASTTDTGMAKVTITVRDAKTYNQGYLTLNGADAADAVKLENVLQVKGGIQENYTYLSWVDLALASDAALQAGAYTIDNFNVQQYITAADLSKTSGTYSITLTFTAVFSP